MKHLILYENFDLGEFVGYHCSNYDITEFFGEITDEDYIRFIDILYILKEDYPEANDYIERITNLDEDEEDYDDEQIELASEIEYFFKENNLEWIYVSEQPLYKYGDKCYNVYFDSREDLYSMSDDLVSDATIYVYKTTNKPKLHQY